MFHRNAYKVVVATSESGEAYDNFRSILKKGSRK